MTTSFEIGKTYMMRSICDYDCIWRYKVVKRTACTVTLQQIHYNGELSKDTINCRILKGYSTTEEVVRPLGSYSMCPTLSSSRPC